MGIERFFNSIAKNNLLKNNNGIILGLEKKLICDMLYIDFNSIVYTVATILDDELQYLLYSLLLGGSHLLTQDAKNIAKRLNFDLETASLDKYKDTFTSDRIDEIALDRIKEYIIFMVSKLVDSNSLIKLYIAIDGVPQMSKIVEQKRRRYMGKIVSGLKHKLREKYIDENKSLPEIRKLFEQYKVGHDRAKITSGTSFMDNVATLLKSDELTTEIKKICPHMIKYIVSTHDIPGEGEKKIIEDILLNKTKGSYTIFSPDADVIILAMIVQSMLDLNSVDTTFDVLRFNQQTTEYDTINITKLIDNIYAYVQKELTIDKTLINKTNVALDISLLFTLFGNDFVPKIESIDARHDVTTLMNNYCSMLNTTKKIKQLVYTDGDKFKIEYDNLIKLFEHMAQIESELLCETYLASTFKNYNFLKRVFGSSNIYQKIKLYISESSKIFKFIEENVRYNSNEMHMKKYIKACLMSKMIKVSDEILLYYIRIEGKVRIDDVNLSDTDKLYWKCANVIANSVRELHLNSTFRLNFNLLPQDNSATSEYHMSNIYDKLPHPLMEITKYDVKSYELERKMGSWEGLLNASDYTMGMVNVNRVYEKFTNRNRYSLYEYPFKKGMTDYYTSAFNVDINDNEKMKGIVSEYLKGILWVFEFYFNKNNQDENLKFVPIWFYKFHKAPLMTQIVKYMNVDYLNKLHKSLDSDEFTVERDMYMTKIEHYIYVSPYKSTSHDTLSRHEIPRKSAIPEKYVEFRNDPRNIRFFPRLEPIIDQIWKPTRETPDISTIIDCRRIPFLNKCHLHCVETISFNEYMSAIKHLRDDTTKVKMGREYSKNWEGQLLDNIFDNRENALFLKHYFKSAYIQSQNIDDKKIYKLMKSICI